MARGAQGISLSGAHRVAREHHPPNSALFCSKSRTLKPTTCRLLNCHSAGTKSRCRPPKDKIINIARRRRSVIEETLRNNKTQPALESTLLARARNARARARHPFNHTARRFAAVSGKLVGDEGLWKNSARPSLACKTHTASAHSGCPCNCTGGGGARAKAWGMTTRFLID